jgi:hypothetical protein
MDDERDSGKMPEEAERQWKGRMLVVVAVVAVWMTAVVIKRWIVFRKMIRSGVWRP